MARFPKCWQAAAAATALLVLDPSWVVAAPVSVDALLRQPNVIPSVNWSGYSAANAYYSGVSALLQVPKSALTDQVGATYAWIGVGGASAASIPAPGSPPTPANPNDLIQAGVAVAQAGATVRYYAWYEMLPDVPKQAVMDIGGGDWVQVDIHEQAYNLWQITIVDGTQVFQQSFPYASSHGSVEWILEAPFVPVPSLSVGVFAPLNAIAGANFTHMQATANSRTAIPAQLAPKEWVLLGPPGGVSAIPLTINPDGASFTATTGVIRSA